MVMKSKYKNFASLVSNLSNHSQLQFIVRSLNGNDDDRDNKNFIFEKNFVLSSQLNKDISSHDGVKRRVGRLLKTETTHRSVSRSVKNRDFLSHRRSYLECVFDVMNDIRVEMRFSRAIFATVHTEIKRFKSGASDVKTRMFVKAFWRRKIKISHDHAHSRSVKHG